MLCISSGPVLPSAGVNIYLNISFVYPGDQSCQVQCKYLPDYQCCTYIYLGDQSCQVQGWILTWILLLKIQGISLFTWNQCFISKKPVQPSAGVDIHLNISAVYPGNQSSPVQTDGLHDKMIRFDTFPECWFDEQYRPKLIVNKSGLTSRNQSILFNVTFRFRLPTILN